MSEHVVLVRTRQLVHGRHDQDLLDDVVLLRFDVLDSKDRLGVVVVKDLVLAVLHVWLRTSDVWECGWVLA